MSTVLIEPVTTHRDPRGALFEPLSDAELAGQRNVHVVLTMPNEVRGNHLHRVATEITSVVGPCLVRLKEPRAFVMCRFPREKCGALRSRPVCRTPFITPAAAS